MSEITITLIDNNKIHNSSDNSSNNSGNYNSMKNLGASEVKTITLRQ